MHTQPAARRAALAELERTRPEFSALIAQHPDRAGAPTDIQLGILDPRHLSLCYRTWLLPPPSTASIETSQREEAILVVRHWEL